MPELKEAAQGFGADSSEKRVATCSNVCKPYTLRSTAMGALFCLPFGVSFA